MAKAKITKLKLNADQENFCQLFVKPDSEFYGNGTQSYIEAYDRKKRKSVKGGIKSKPMTYETARANASRLLTNPEIVERINTLLEQKGFNSENVDKQHLFLINQFADFKSKLGAIREYNQLKKRITKDPDTQVIIFSNEQKEAGKKAIREYLGRKNN